MSYLSLFIMMSILFSDFCHLCWILYKLDDIQESFWLLNFYMWKKFTI